MPNYHERHHSTSPIPQAAEWGNPFRYHSDHIGHPSKPYPMPWTQPTYYNTRSRSPPKRRWPPPPTAEDEVVALAKESNSDDDSRSQATADNEVVVRGVVDQQPIILEASVASQSQIHSIASDRSSIGTKSSNESLGPRTPEETVDKNYDRRYIYIPQEGNEIPIVYDRLRGSEPRSHVPREMDARGRKDIAPLNTHIEGTQGQTSVDSSRRNPSPYAYTPSPNKGRHSGDYFLSPDAMYSTAWNQNAQRGRDTARSERGKSADHGLHGYDRNSHPEERSFSGPSPVRPSGVRHHSAMADPGSRVRMEQLKHASDLKSSSDEFDSKAPDDKQSARPNSAKEIRPTVHKASNTYSGGQSNVPVKDQTQPPKRRTLSPSRGPVSAYDNGTPSTTLSSSSGSTPHPLLDLDAYFASNLLKQRNKPHRPSPLTSPFSSPPRSPRAQGLTQVNGSPSTGPRSRPTSRPASPLSGQPPAYHLSPIDTDRSTLARSARDGHRSQRSSPLPSPEIREYEPRPGPRIEVQAAPPVSGGRSSSYAGDGHLRSTSRQPSSTPFSTLQSASRSRSREPYHRSSSYVEPKQHMPPLANPSNISPVLPPRSRPTTPKSSVDVASAQPALPPCPRPAFVSGYNDWYMLAGRPNFDVCPPCVEHAVGAGYKAWFVRAPPKPSGLRTKCDFGSPWARIAWLKMLKEKRREPDILYDIASITEEPCPGKIGAIRAWYTLPDPETGKPISNFDICPYCVRAIECIFPSLHGVFRYDHRQKTSKKRACDLRYGSKRFAGYIDRLEAIANKADVERRSPRMHRFVDHAREMAMMRECSKDDMVLDQAWHIMPQLPQLTVCEECYDDVVWPAIDAGSSLAAKFNRSMQIMGPGGVSCQLYSPRMRHVFKDAVRNNDLLYLQQQAVKRYNMERSLQARHGQAQAYGDSEEIARVVQEWKNWE